MPVKVRCRKCEKVFAAPDRARGKAIRCPECREPVKVPGDKRKPTAKTGSAAGSEDETVFSSLDLSQAEDKTARLCPKCASEVSTDEKTCPYCHVDLQTGVVSSRMQKLLKRTGIAMDDIDVFEFNEAFAAQALACMRDLGLADDDPRVNPNGGAIALGHPLGMSGARLLLTAAHELQNSGKRYALCTMCVGVGQGIATLIERV